MFRRGRVFLVLVGLAGGAVGLTHLPEALASTSLLRVTKVEVEGTVHLDAEQVREALDLPPEVSILDDLEPYRARLELHGMVRSAELRKRPLRTVVARVEERVPVAFLPTPTLVPVDGEGRVLPLDPTRDRLDLPVLRVSGLGDAGGVGRDRLPAPGRVTGELERLIGMDPHFAAGISEVGWGEGDALLVRLGDPPVLFQMPVPVRADRLREGLLVLADVMSREEETGPPRAVDLRFEDQVVVRFHSEEGR